MTDAASDSALRAFVEKMTRARGFGLDAYKETCLRRRLAVRMRARGARTYDEYAGLLKTDAEEYEKFLDALTINVTKFYRNRETWDAIAECYLPKVWKMRRGRVRCWSAGCASGEEPYTVAILLLEHTRKLNVAAPTSPRIDATDLDVASIERASTGEYPPKAFDELPAALELRYFESDGTARRISDQVRSLVRFSQHDVIKEDPPNPPYDLILCRNVVIYFDRQTQEQLYLRLADALTPGGYLVLGKVETLLGEARSRFVTEDGRERIYRRE